MAMSNRCSGLERFLRAFNLLSDRGNVWSRDIVNAILDAESASFPIIDCASIHIEKVAEFL